MEVAGNQSPRLLLVLFFPTRPFKYIFGSRVGFPRSFPRLGLGLIFLICWRRLNGPAVPECPSTSPTVPQVLVLVSVVWCLSRVVGSGPNQRGMQLAGVDALVGVSMYEVFTTYTPQYVERWNSTVLQCPLSFCCMIWSWRECFSFYSLTNFEKAERVRMQISMLNLIVT